MWNNGFSEKRPNWQHIFANFNYEWTPKIPLHLPRASDLVSYSYSCSCSKRGLATDGLTTVEGS
jgi:hypothetical protein